VKHSRNKKNFVFLATVVGGLFLLGAIFLAALQLANAGRVVYGLKLAGLPLGGLNFNEAQSVLAAKIQDFSQQKIELRFGQKSWQFTPEQLGFDFDANQAAGKAVTIGHQENPLMNIQEQVQALLAKKNLTLVLSLDETRFSDVLNLLSEIEHPAQNARLVYDSETDDWQISPEIQGAVIDRVRLKEILRQNLSQLSESPIELTLSDVVPPVTKEKLKLVKNQAQEIINQSPYFLKIGSSTWAVDKSEIASWMATEPSSDLLTFDGKAIADFLAPIAPLVNQKPTNAQLTNKDGKVEISVPPQNGQALDVFISAKKITRAILAGEKEIELIIYSAEPEISSSTIETLGLTSLLAQGESNFAGSPANRLHNIVLGASKLNGLLISPGEEFSFAQSIGEVDEQNGWLPELVIKGKQTLPEAGGGICQVSTTLFRAAINSGLKITERYPHAYPVRYYNPQGFDATVYPPHPDLRFINSTPNHILLQSKVVGTKLIFEIYGRPDGREVKVIGPVITQSKPDGSLKTKLTQEIWYNGVLARRDVFNSSYNSPNLYPVTRPAASSPSATPSLTAKN